MSREFGRYESGYFHTLIRNCAEDAAKGDYEITRKWGAVLDAMKNVAWAIASAEACDSNESEPIIVSLRATGKIREALDALDVYLAPFRSVAERTVRDSLGGAGAA